jgi:hypothetical protein
VTSRRVAVLASAVLGLVVAGIVAAAFGLGRDTGSGGDGSAGTPGRRQAVEVVAELSHFVASARQLDFKHPVPVTFLDDRRFRSRLLAESGQDKADVELTGRVLRAVGLLGKGDDLYASLLEFTGDAVVGFYDPRSGDLVLRGTTITPYVRMTLAHELTHALDDQWFRLDRPALDHGDDEAALAFTSLAEGDAVRVGERFRAAMSAADRTQAAIEEEKRSAGVDVTNVPRIVQQVVTFPYTAGPPFVHALLVSGGERRVDAAFRTPPTTSEDILDPTGWLNGRRPLRPPVPKADGRVIDKGIYGLSSLLATLEPVVGTDEATRAATGWGGDAYVAWDAGRGSTCVRATFAMDTPGDLDELTTAIREWATEQGAEVERDERTVTFTSCG